MRGLEVGVSQVLDRRLLRDRPWPIAMALSGGGDSLALTLVVDAWARQARRELLILNVDHGLRPESRDWTAACGEVAERLGRPFQALSWDGEKPVAGLPAAARTARHRLLADAARGAGAKVVLMGHTADDIAEAAAMRQTGSTTPSPREWSPSPAWPEGRGVFLLRPMLRVARAELRRWLETRRERWIDDPANIDPRYARSRARLAGVAALDSSLDAPPLALAAQAREMAGIIVLPRAVLRDAPDEQARRFMALATVCAGGGARLPQAARVDALATRLGGPEDLVASLAGARVEADAEEVRVFREAGEAKRAAPADVELPGVWDGRFDLAGPGTARGLADLRSRLPQDQQHALKAFPAAARGALPVVIGDDGDLNCPALQGASSLIGDRLRAAAGLIDREPD